MSSVKTVFNNEIRRFRLEASQPFGDLKQQLTKLHKVPESCELTWKYQDDENEWVTVSSDVELIEALRVSQASNSCLKLFVEVASKDPKAIMSLAPVEEKRPAAQAPPSSGNVSSVAGLAGLPQTLLDNIASITVEDESGNALLHVENPAEAEGEETADGETSGESNVHQGVTCDMCGVSPIVGVRYKCKTCHNYDLCETCEAKEVHPTSHVLMKLRLARGRGTGRGHWMRHIKSFFAGGRRSQYRAEFVDNTNKKDDLPRIKAGAVLNQVWRVKNNGDVAWPAGTCLQHHHGRLVFAPVSGANQSVAVPIAQPGETVEIKATLTPVDAIRKRVAGKFFLATAEGAKFGPLLWACALIDAETSAPAAARARAAIAAPAAASAPPAPVIEKVQRVAAPEVKRVSIPENYPYVAQLKEIEDIFGAERRDTFLELLMTAKGNVQQVVDWVLAESAAPAAAAAKK